MAELLVIGKYADWPHGAGIAVVQCLADGDAERVWKERQGIFWRARLSLLGQGPRLAAHSAIRATTAK